jgi:VIT1/CCC1 family predicted Fe2+/Mn2+ transporter
MGIGFGLTSGVITTVGLMVGLHAGTHSRIAVVGGILTVAVADALSDALGIHLAEEARAAAMTRHVWEATVSTFLAKLITASTFAIPVLLLELRTSILVSIFWGLLVLVALTTVLARQQGLAPWRAISEHVLVAAGVVTASYYVGHWVKELIQ